VDPTCVAGDLLYAGRTPDDDPRPREERPPTMTMTSDRRAGTLRETRGASAHRLADRIGAGSRCRVALLGRVTLTLVVAAAVAGPATAGVSAAPAPVRGTVAHPPTASELVPLPILRFAVSRATVKYFPIEGTTYRQLIASIADASSGPCGVVEPVVTGGEPIVAGCAKPTFRARTLTTRSCYGSACTTTCKVTTVTGSATVYLPQWVAPDLVPSALLGWWRSVAADIRRHEARHVTIFTQYLAKLRRDAVGKSCASWTSISRRWSTKEDAAQRAFDVVEYAKAWPEPPAEDY
jgi:predicted secreted Zn-dependent protease